MHFDDSAAGFAVAPDREMAEKNSALEALERWRIALWVDDGIDIPVETMPPPLLFAKNDFDAHEVRIESRCIFINGRQLDTYLCVFLGLLGKGVFVGYGCKTSKEEAVTHAVIEALRNKSIYVNQKGKTGFPYNRIHYFAENGLSKQVVQKIIGK